LRALHFPFVWLTGHEFERGRSRLRADDAVDDALCIAPVLRAVGGLARVAGDGDGDGE
jgi:hypothetical protein